MSPITLLLVDDQNIILDGLNALLEQDERFSIAGRASDGCEAVAKARALRPDVIVLDINMPVMDGIEAARALRAWRADQKILMLSMYANRDFVIELLDAGVSGYILKNAGRKEFLQAILSVAGGLRHLSSEIQEVMDMPSPRVRKPGAESTMPTRREKEIIRMILGEHSTQQIAVTLGLSPQTVETHRKNILSKLGLHSSTGLARYALERGWMAI